MLRRRCFSRGRDRDAAVLLEVKRLVDDLRARGGSRSPASRTCSTTSTAGKPQTILVIGSDRRYIDRKSEPARSDTMILVRLDPDKRARPRCMSIPRDLKVDDPAATATDKINAAYSLGGPS